MSRHRFIIGLFTAWLASTSVDAGESPRVIGIAAGRHELEEPIRAAKGALVLKVRGEPVREIAIPASGLVIRGTGDASFSGGKAIKGVMGSDGKWRATLPEGAWNFRHISVNGVIRHAPRWPREGNLRMAGLAGQDAKAKYNTPMDRFEFAEGDWKKDWKHADQIEVVVIHYWVDTHLKVKEVDWVNRTVRLDRLSRRKFTDDHGDKPGFYYLRNVAEALEPGTFFFDPKTRELVYWPLKDEAVKEVVVPSLASVLALEGIEHVTFENLSFRDSTWEPAAKEAVDVQASGVVPGAVKVGNAKNIAFKRCTFRNLTGYGLEIGPGSRGIEVSDCLFEDLGAGGIKMAGKNAKDEATRLTGCTITHNELRHLGRHFHSGVGILMQHTDGNTVEANHIHDLYYTGISVGWVWGYGPSATFGNTIKGNHIHTVGQGKLSDMGGIYMLGIQPGTRIESNVIHDVESRGYGGWGIYTDEGSTDVTVTNNLVYKTKSGGFHQHYGRENKIVNNIFALARVAQVERTRMEPHSSFTFERNIVYYREGPLLGKNWKDDKFTIDRNLYWNAAGPVVFPGNLDLKAWQARGFDKESLVVDPLFVDPDKGDFTLKQGSPAGKIGFVPFDYGKTVREAGIR